MIKVELVIALILFPFYAAGVAFLTTLASFAAKRKYIKEIVEETVSK